MMIPYRHRIILVRDVEAVPPVLDDRGHPVTTETELATFDGWVQPRSARERASVAGSDVNIGSHRIYLEPNAIGVVGVDDRLRKEAVDPDPDLAGTYRIVEIDNAAGMGAFLSVGADLIRP